ncbi:MAG: YicC family protein [Candidatus Omnitrophica bacterium]|nr:YicC family protein [Candidatus Omnitrophota bacterium]
MIRSMTGFGKGIEQYEKGKIEVEVKSLNHKALSINCNPFNDIFLLEKKLQEAFSKKVFKGKVFVKITCEETGGETSSPKIKINEKVVRDYKRKIKEIQKQFNIKGDIEIRDIMSYPGVVETVSGKKKTNTWPHIKKALNKAIDKLVVYRISEGRKMAVDFRKRLTDIENKIKDIKKYGKKSVEDHRKKLIQATKGIMDGEGLDKLKLENEVALFARNCDIAEETTRLSGHVSTYKSAMKNVKSDVGKKLDFIAQEMQREANTIGSKSSDFKISKAVIDVKSQIEKIREQVRNIE